MTPLEGQQIVKIDLSSDTELKLHTTKGVLSAYIDPEQSCCERFGAVCTSGYITTEEEEPQTFIGATILEVTTTNKDWVTDSFSKDCDEGDYAFININTTKGFLQFAIYNEHNGYYGHYAYIKYTEKKESLNFFEGSL